MLRSTFNGLFVVTAQIQIGSILAFTSAPRQRQQWFLPELTQSKIARAAGLRTSNLTYYFPLKADLLAVILETSERPDARQKVADHLASFEKTLALRYDVSPENPTIARLADEVRGAGLRLLLNPEDELPELNTQPNRGQVIWVLAQFVDRE